jgi:hypothetical protein
VAIRLLVASTLLVVALDGGGYGLSSRHALAVLVWWTLFLGVSTKLLPEPPIDRTGAGAIALFAGYSILALSSAFWSSDVEAAVLEADRALLYLGVLILTVTLARPALLTAWSDGLAIGIVAVASIALTSRLFPGLIAAPRLSEYLPNADARLSYPLNYWNGLGLLCALAVPLLLRAAVDAKRPLVRAMACAPLPAFAAVFVYTSSRGAVLVACAGATLFVVLTHSRRRSAALGALSAAGALAAVLVVLPSTSGAMTNGARVGSAVLLLGVSAATGVGAAAFGGRLPERLPVPSLRLAIPFAVGFVGLGLLAIDPGQRLAKFRMVPAEPSATTVADHLSSGSGSGRWQFWSSALDAFGTAPILGRGAGSFEAWWAQHGTLAVFIRDSHSLYFETLAELGLLGLLLICGMIAFAAASGLRNLTADRGGPSSTRAALLATAAAYVLAAGIDWMWEMTVVSLVGFVCFGLILVRPRAPERTRGASAATLLAVVACACFVIELLPLLARAELDASRTAAAKGDLTGALDHAERARVLQPWGSTPYVQIALVHERAAQTAAAREAIRRAIDRDPSDWRLWLLSARFATKDADIAEARRTLARARELNPRSPFFAPRR